jgi:transposase-like protein
METKKRREYTPAERKAVLADVRRIGVAETATKHGVPKSCVSRWASAAGVKREVGEESAGAAARRSATTTRSTKATTSVKSTSAPTLVEGAPAAPAAKRVLRTRIAKVYTPSQKAEVIEYASAHGVTAASTQFDISRFSIYDWRNKVAKAAKGEGPSPTSGPAPTEIEATRDREILAEWHKHPGLGPSQIRNQLRRAGIKVAVHTVRRVMEDAGYRPPKVKREPHDQRYEAIRPNHLWHLDFVQRHINRASTFTLILIDDYSRFVVGEPVDDAKRRRARGDEGDRGAIRPPEANFDAATAILEEATEGPEYQDARVRRGHAATARDAPGDRNSYWRCCRRGA